MCFSILILIPKFTEDKDERFIKAERLSLPSPLEDRDSDDENDVAANAVIDLSEKRESRKRRRTDLTLEKKKFKAKVEEDITL